MQNSPFVTNSDLAQLLADTIGTDAADNLPVTPTDAPDAFTAPEPQPEQPVSNAPATSKPAKPSKPSKRAAKPSKPAKPATAKPATPAQPVGPYGQHNITRTAGVIVGGAYPVSDNPSGRDDAYALFYGRVCEAVGGDKRSCTLADLAAYGSNPYYNGSNKPHDAGAITRARKFGLISVSDSGNRLRLTDSGTKRFAAIAAKHPKPLPKLPSAS